MSAFDDAIDLYRSPAEFVGMVMNDDANFGTNFCVQKSLDYLVTIANL